MRYGTLTILAAIAVITAACSGGGTVGGLDAEQSYTIALNSAKEVPAPKPTLALFAPGTATGAINGTFASGSFTAANLPAGVTLASLKTLLLSGNAYVNVHTVANPAGEMRGQLE